MESRFSSEEITAKPATFNNKECHDFVKAMLESKLKSQNGLSGAFNGSSGFQVIFTSEGKRDLIANLPFLKDFFNASAKKTSNSFFLNILIVGQMFEVKRHLDCSLNAFVHRHLSPDRVSVLYVQIPSDLRGGTLNIYDNSGALNSIKPQVGLLVQFKGDFLHEISAGTTSGERISFVLEEYNLDQPTLAYIPSFSLQSALNQTDSTSAYQKILEFAKNLTREERDLIKENNII